MKILFIDIETAPNTAYVWRLFKENVPLKALIETSYVLCWAAKWMDEQEVMFGSVQEGAFQMLSRVHALLDKADVVVHFNGKSFDIPTLNREFLLFGLHPPAPYKQVDLMLVAKDKFRFVSNKLDHIAEQLQVGKKHDTTFELWIGCMKDDPESWKKMEAYNKQDVQLLVDVYFRFRPWIKDHPNKAIYTDARQCCPNCGSTKYQKRGFHYASVSKYQRYYCTNCGNWFREGTNQVRLTKEVFRNVT